MVSKHCMVACPDLSRSDGMEYGGNPVLRLPGSTTLQLMRSLDIGAAETKALASDQIMGITLVMMMKMSGVDIMIDKIRPSGPS